MKSDSSNSPFSRNIVSLSFREKPRSQFSKYWKACSSNAELLIIGPEILLHVSHHNTEFPTQLQQLSLVEIGVQAAVGLNSGQRGTQVVLGVSVIAETEHVSHIYN